MKEATSELGSGVVVVSSVAILIAFFSYTVLPIIKNSIKKDTSCSKAVCDTSKVEDGYVNCIADGVTMKCKYKG